MAEENIKEVIEEIQGADEETLHSTIEKWFESTRTAGMKIGAQYISAAIFGIIEKHLKKKTKPSLRDYQRAIEEIVGIIAIQLTRQSDLLKNDGNKEEIDVSGEG